MKHLFAVILVTVLLALAALFMKEDKKELPVKDPEASENIVTKDEVLDETYAEEAEEAEENFDQKLEEATTPNFENEEVSASDADTRDSMSSEETESYPEPSDNLPTEAPTYNDDYVEPEPESYDNSNDYEDDGGGYYEGDGNSDY